MRRFLSIGERALAFLVLLLAVVFAAAALRVNRLSARALETYPPAGKFADVAGGQRLHYIDAGQGSGERPPVVLLHGNPGSVADFDRLIPALIPDHRVIAFDRPGHGHSERPDLRTETPRSQAAKVHTALQQLGVRRPILVGHSWGGALVLAYAIEFPDDLAGMVLIGTRAYPSDEPPDPLYQLLRTPVLGGAVRHTLVPLAGRGTLQARLAAAYRPDTVQSDHAAHARAMWMRPAELGATVWDTWLLQDAASEMERRYATLGPPAMLLVGDSDDLLHETDQLSRQLPGAWIRVVPTAGHYLIRTHVAAVVRTISELEARLKGMEVRR